MKRTGMGKAGSLSNAFYKMLTSKSKEGGNEKMDIKSRYEVIAEREERKRNLIQERDGFDDRLKKMRNGIRDDERELQDTKDDLKEFEKTIEDRKKTIKELITSVEDSLKRLSNLKK
jgi:septal ring factor EnvC (AmiA/AmiB activator)